MKQVLARLTPAFTGAMTTKASRRSMVALKERPPISRAQAPLAAPAPDGDCWREFLKLTPLDKDGRSESSVGVHYTFGGLTPGLIGRYPNWCRSSGLLTSRCSNRSL